MGFEADSTGENKAIPTGMPALSKLYWLPVTLYQTNLKRIKTTIKPSPLLLNCTCNVELSESIQCHY